MTEVTIRSLLEEALDHHRQGRVQEAERLYRQVLDRNPDDADALHLSGLAALQSGDAQAALARIRRAIVARPDAAPFFVSLAQALAANGLSQESIAAYRKAIALASDCVEAWFGLGLALQGGGQLNEAVAAYRRLLAVEPNRDDALINLGGAHEQLGQIEQAVAAYRRALDLQPGSAAAYSNLGSALRRAGKFDEAIAACRWAIELAPTFAAAHNNLGCALTDARRPQEAVDALRRSLAIRPDFQEAWFNLANASKECGDWAGAANAYRRSVEIRPDRVDGWINLGNVLQAMHDFEAAAGAYRSALAAEPGHVAALSNLAVALRHLGRVDESIAALEQCVLLRPEFHVAHCNLGSALKDVGRIDEAIQSFRRAVELCPSDAVSHSNLAYSVHFRPGMSAEDILRENRQWEAVQAAGMASMAHQHDNVPDPHRRLRIGYMGSDFREHCQSLFTIPLFANHNRTQVEIICYANVAQPDAVTRRLMGLVDLWRPTAGLSDSETAQLVRSDRVDLLVDLTLHMSSGRPLVMARKPAPVQVAYLAYPGTTGLTAVDYRLTDPYLDPPGDTDAHYAERSIRLPETFWCYDPGTSQPVPNALPASAGGRITFGCLNNFCKVTDETLALWARVLAAVTNSRLMILAFQGRDRERVCEQFRLRDVQPERIEFANYRPRNAYLELYHRIDLGLDTLPYNGHTTSLDSFWMGVPVVTRVGRTAVGRAGLSQLSNLGLPELVAHSDAEFVSIVSELAGDLPRLAELRCTLRARMERSPLMDAARFAGHVETAYRQMWAAWCRDSSRGV